ncbi:uncharacterized protein LOC134242589, partial [Saccostrea cucullata]
DFEEEWIELEHNFSVIFDSGNSPKDPYKSPLSKKRKIEEAEDSLILNRKKFGKQPVKAGVITQQIEQEDPLLKNFKQENPSKYIKLEKRMTTRDLLNTSFTEKSASTTMFQETWAPTQSPPVYSPVSPPVVPLSTQTQTSGLTPIEAPGFWNKPIQFPLKEELDALNELVDNVRMDLLQTSMLVNYIQGFMKKFQY